MSLLYTIKGLDSQRYNASVAVAAPEGEVVQFYKENGLNAVAAPELTQLHFSTVAPRYVFMLITWKEIITFIFKRKSCYQRMDNLIAEFKPDIVHLNSMPLSTSALYLKQKNIPFIWHVREPAQTLSPISLRRKIIGKLLRELPKASIFLSDYDRKSWAVKENSNIIPNFIDFNIFNKEINSENIKVKYNIPKNFKILLFAGGLRAVKGIFSLIKALKIVAEKNPNIICIMPGSDYDPPQSFVMSIAKTIGPFINQEPTGLRAIKMINKLKLDRICLRLPYCKDIQNIIAAADIVVFPSTKPHFARPVIEASAMGKAVIASDLPGVRELINNKTGVLVPPGDHILLAEAISNLLNNPELRQTLGENGYDFAKQNFSHTKACENIMSIYDKALGNL